MNIRLNKTQLNNLFTTELLDKFNDIGMKVFAGYFEVTSPDVNIETFSNNFRFTINDLRTLISTNKDHTVSIIKSSNYKNRTRKSVLRIYFVKRRKRNYVLYRC